MGNSASIALALEANSGGVRSILTLIVVQRVTASIAALCNRSFNSPSPDYVIIALMFGFGRAGFSSQKPDISSQ